MACKLWIVHRAYQLIMLHMAIVGGFGVASPLSPRPQILGGAYQIESSIHRSAETVTSTSP